MLQHFAPSASFNSGEAMDNSQMSFNELVSQCERDDRESNASSTEFYRGINDEIDKSYKEVASNSEEEIDLRATVLAIMLLFL